MKWVRLIFVFVILTFTNSFQAHYAKFCVDAELLTSYGWVECVGCADRSAYDLTCHTKATGVPLVVRETRKEPLIVTEYVAETQKAKFGPHFKKNGKTVQTAVDELTQELKEKLSLELKKDGKISIDVPGVGDGKVELTTGTQYPPYNIQCRAYLRRPYQD
jgi:glycyl-tRNA synthetase